MQNVEHSWVSQTWVASVSHLEKPSFCTSQVVITGFLNQQRFFNFYSFLTQSYVIWWGHWAVSISSISQAENVPNENPLILRTTVHLPCTNVYLRLPTFTPLKLPNLSIWSFTTTWKNMLGNIFHWYLKPIIFQPRTYKHTTQTRCVCQIVTYHNFRIRKKKLWITKRIPWITYFNISIVYIRIYFIFY